MISIVFQQQLRLSLRSPALWIMLGCMQLLFAWLFLSQIEGFLAVQSKLALLANNPGVSGYLLLRYLPACTLIIMLITPLLTMHSIAGEREQQSLPLVLSSPIPMSSWVIGKFFAISAIQALITSLIFLPLLLLSFFTQPDLLLFSIAATGVFLFGLTCSAIGLLCSALCKQPLTAGFISIAILLLQWLFQFTAQPNQATTGLQQLSLQQHLDAFFSGLIGTQHVLYFVVVSVFCLLIAIRRMENERFI